MINIIKSQFVSKLDFIERFNGNLTIQQKERVSTHSFWVTFYVNLLFRELFWNAFQASNIFSLAEYFEMYNFTLRQALFHDVPEIFTGDLLSATKYHDAGGNDIRKGLTNIIWDEVEAMPHGILKMEMTAALNSDSKLGITNITIEQKIVAHNIVKLCDWIGCAHYAYPEIALGNTAFNKVWSRCIAGVKECQASLLKALQDSGIPFSQSAIETII